MAEEEAFPNENDLASQGNTWEPLTPSDDADFDRRPKAIHISSEVGGVFIAVDKDGGEAPFYGAPGAFLPIRPKRIKTTDLPEGMTFTGLMS